MDHYNNIVFFDGVCVLCNRSVNFLIKRDNKKLLKFASLQPETAKQIFSHSDDQQDDESVIFYSDGNIYKKSAASIKIAKYLKFPWNTLKILQIIPVSLRDIIYDYVARKRYKWFGKTNQCLIPPEDLKDRFLEFNKEKMM